MDMSKRSRAGEGESASSGTTTRSELVEDPFTPAPLYSLPSAWKHSSPAPTSPPEREEVEVKTPLVSPGTILPTITEPSRLAHRFAPTPDPVLVTLFPDPGERFDLPRDATTLLGRDARRNDLALFNSSVSQRHCQIVVEDDECILTDLGSSNGTFVNGERLTEPRHLKQGDLIVVGRFVFCFLWFPFAREQQPEAMSFRDIRELMIQLYPTPSSIQSLLLATNLFNLHVDLVHGTPETIWDGIFEQLRRHDVLGPLEMILSCTLRDHSGNREVRRALQILQRWKSTRQQSSLQDQVNTDARNSSRVVREILSNLIDINTDNILGDLISDDPDPSSPPPDYSGSSPDRTVEVRVSRGRVERPAPAPRDLPFDVKEEPSDVAGRGPSRTETGSSGQQTTTPWSVSTAQEIPEHTLEDLPRMESDASSEVTESMASSENSVIESAVIQPSVGDENTPVAPVTIAEAQVKAAAEPRVRSRRRLLWVAASLLGLLGAGGLGYLYLGSAATDSQVASESGASKRPKKAAEAKSSDASSAAQGDASSAGPAPAASPAAGSAPVPSPAPAADTGSGSASKLEAGGTGKPEGKPMVPVWKAINFLDEGGSPAYSSSSVPDPEAWDGNLSQIVSDRVTGCVWVGERTRTFASKPGMTFLYTTCELGSSRVEGWVNRKGLKPST